MEANILKGIRFALHWSCSAFRVLAFLGVLLFAQTTKRAYRSLRRSERPALHVYAPD